MKSRNIFFISTFAILVLFSDCSLFRHKHVCEKPVIYLYPQKSELVSVKLKLSFPLTFTLPAYHSEWKVIANSDGSIFNPRDGNTYPYLFWEGSDDHDYSFTKGFCVKGDSTKSFLKTTLAKIGLNAKESNEFIEYWAPVMQKNPYNLITFPGKEFTDRAQLEIVPAPDAVLRVMMIFKSAATKTSIPAQTFSPFVRKGFSVVEWGGENLDQQSVE